jgi:beta-glucosidase
MWKWRLEEKDGYALIINEGGKTLGYSPAYGIRIIEADGYAFKDLNGNGTLDPYEDWRLPTETRVKDLAARLSIKDIAGLMLYSAHQSVSVPRADDPFALRFAGTYDGEPFSESGADISDLSDQQKEFLDQDRLRHVLVTSVESPETAARWNNNLQAFCEGRGFGIPVNISTDPRHGAESNGEYQVGAGGQISQWPSSLGLAASFDPALVRRFGEIASAEYRALGIATALSPQVDLATDPRWSRYSGTFGEGTRLTIDMARAYCDGFQTSSGADELETGWGYQSVNAMVKHWPGGGAGEGGRDAHFAYGKFAVYPGGNFDEAMKPFTEGAFSLDGPTGQAAAVMPYYTISYGQDIKNGENVGNSYSSYIIDDLLRNQCGYDGVVCTDWGITKDNPAPDSFGTTSWGVHHLNENERHYKAIMAGVDQFGGNNNAAPVLAAYEMGCAARGEVMMRSRMEQSARRLLRNMFRTGLFENPYCDVNRTSATVGNPDFMQAGYEAQQKSVVLLKNKNQVLPMKRCKVYIPDRYSAPGKNMFGMATPERRYPAVARKIVEGCYDIAETPEEADFALVFMDSPASTGYDRERGGYLPITLQYRPYTAVSARAQSIGYGDPYDEIPNRSYRGRNNTAHNEADLDILLDTKKLMGNKPVIVSLCLKNPTVMNEFEPYADGILVSFECQAQAVLDIISGACEPSGLMPCQIPADMETVETQFEDVPLDMSCHTDDCGNTYGYAFGLNWSGVIRDGRTEKYK